MKPKQLAVAVYLITPVVTLNGYAQEFGGTIFPSGAASFADAVIVFDPLLNGGPAPTEPAAIDPTTALGPPDFPVGGSVGDPGSVSLGDGGLLELAFVNNTLTNSGDSLPDLQIFEVGPDIEDTFIGVRPTDATRALLSAAQGSGATFLSVGRIFGSTSAIDVDAIFPGFAPGTLFFDAVQLIDDSSQGGQTGVTVGADIDAVGAIFSADPQAIPDPITPGDFNSDGTVDAADYTVWRDNFGEPIALPNETVTIGQVTIEDYATFFDNFGTTNSLAVASAVPEPPYTILLAAAAMSLLSDRRHISKYPPAEPEALKGGPLEAVGG